MPHLGLSVIVGHVLNDLTGSGELYDRNYLIIA